MYIVYLHVIFFFFTPPSSSQSSEPAAGTHCPAARGTVEAATGGLGCLTFWRLTSLQKCHFSECTDETLIVLHTVEPPR